MGAANDLINAILKKAIYDLALKAAITRLIYTAPWLALPVIHPVFVFIMTKLAGLLYEEMALRVDFSVIDFETEQERRQYEAAVAELMKLSANPTPEELERAREEIRRRLADLIRFPGVR